jgi:hypothetical protein
MITGRQGDITEERRGTICTQELGATTTHNVQYDLAMS